MNAPSASIHISEILPDVRPYRGHVRMNVEPITSNPYYFDDSLVVLKVEEKIYKIHRYFLVRESEFFKDLFSLPQSNSETVEGLNDEHPICVPNTPIKEFDNLLRFFYFGMHDDYKLDVTDWIAMLSIATRMNFPKVRERSIKEITAHLEEIDPFDLIGLAVKYDVEQWLMPAYRKIVTRPGLIGYDEAQKVPFPMAVMLMRSREQHWKAPRHNSYTDPRSAADYILNSEIARMGQASNQSQPA